MKHYLIVVSIFTAYALLSCRQHRLNIQRGYSPEFSLQETYI